MPHELGVAILLFVYEPRTRSEKVWIVYGAMRGYYRALSDLERARFNSNAVQAAEDAMKSAEGSLAFLADEPTTVWEDFWQEARALSEMRGK